MERSFKKRLGLGRLIHRFTLGYLWTCVEENLKTIAVANKLLRSYSTNVKIKGSPIGTVPGIQSYGICAKKKFNQLDMVVEIPTALGAIGADAAKYCYNCTMNLSSTGD